MAGPIVATFLLVFGLVGGVCTLLGLGLLVSRGYSLRPVHSSSSAKYSSRGT